MKAEVQKIIRKSDMLQTWQQMKPLMALTPDENPFIGLMEILPANFKGNKFGHDCIRIEGSMQFILVVMSLLKPLSEMENGNKRLELITQELNPKDVSPPLNKKQSHWVCYIRLIERDGQSVMPEDQ